MRRGDVVSIPTEYDTLNKTVMPTTIIMDGGGNDVLSEYTDVLRSHD